MGYFREQVHPHLSPFCLVRPLPREACGEWLEKPRPQQGVTFFPVHLFQTGPCGTFQLSQGSWLLGIRPSEQSFWGWWLCCSLADYNGAHHNPPPPTSHSRESDCSPKQPIAHTHQLLLICKRATCQSKSANSTSRADNREENKLLYLHFFFKDLHGFQRSQNVHRSQRDLLIVSRHLQAWLDNTADKRDVFLLGSHRFIRTDLSTKCSWSALAERIMGVF